MKTSVVLAAFFFAVSLHAEFVITATAPTRNATSAPRTTDIQATTDDNVDTATVTQSTFRIQGNQTGRINGTSPRRPVLRPAR